MTALIEKIASTSFAQRLAHFLVPHSANKHRPYLLRHQSLFAITFLILAVQFFSFGNITSARVLGYATNITASKIIQLTNQERTSRGISPLNENTLLDKSASLKAADMFAKDYWNHFAPDGTSPWYFFKLSGYNYSWAGENLARDFNTSEGVVAGWMASTGHRENMLNPNFKDIGIAVMNGTLTGVQTTLVVEHLGSTLDTLVPSTPVAAPTFSQPTNIEDTLKNNSNSKNKATVSAKITNNTTEKLGSVVPSYSFDLAAFWQGLGLGQRTTLFLLGILASLFAFDSFLIIRKGHLRENSHSLLHAGVIAVLIVALVRSATGGIL